MDFYKFLAVHSVLQCKINFEKNDFSRSRLYLNTGLCKNRVLGKKRDIKIDE